MPAALDVDHDKVRAVALVVGVREAARQFELSEDAVRQWSKREGWFKHVQAAQEARLVKQEKQGVSPAVTKSQSDVLLSFNGKSKLLGAKVGHSMLKNISKVKGLSQVALAQPFAQTVGALSKIHQWDQSVHNTQVNVQVVNTQSIPDA